MISIKKIKPQEEIDELCAEFRKIDSHLYFPRSGNVKSFDAYTFKLNGRYGVKISKYIRNSLALEKLEAFINRLDTFFIGIEYFSKKIIFERTEGQQLPEKYKDEFFISAMTDSLRSSLDIFSKYLAWFYDLDERDEIGFSYKKLIEPLKNYSKIIAQELNIIYKSSEYIFIKNIRDLDKHIGKNQNQIKLERSLQRFNFEFKRAQPISFNEFERNSCSLFNMIKQLLFISIEENCNTKMGYDSNNDVEIIEDHNGNFVKL